MTSSRSRHPILGMLLAAGFILAGALHFMRPHAYERIIPDWLPSHGALVAISGVAEIAGGVGLLHPRLRQPAAWGLVALLAAVFPANAYMLTEHERVAPGIPTWLLVARLPLQPLLMWLVWISGRRPTAT